MRVVYEQGMYKYISINYDPKTLTHSTIQITLEEYEKYKDLLCSEDTTVTKMILELIKNERK